MRVQVEAAGGGRGGGDGGRDWDQRGNLSFAKQRLRFLLGDPKERGNAVILWSGDPMATERAVSRTVESGEWGEEEELVEGKERVESLVYTPEGV